MMAMEEMETKEEMVAAMVMMEEMKEKLEDNLLLKD
jgi:hypothetical protein